MQFGGAQGQYTNHRQIGLMRIGRHLVAGRCGSILLEMTLQILERVGPTIALIGDIALQHRKQLRFTVGGDIFQCTGQRRTVGIARHFGEINSHLELRIRSRAQTAVTLEHQSLADDDDGIRTRTARPRHR